MLKHVFFWHKFTIVFIWGESKFMKMGDDCVVMKCIYFSFIFFNYSCCTTHCPWAVKLVSLSTFYYVFCMYILSKKRTKEGMKETSSTTFLCETIQLGELTVQLHACLSLQSLLCLLVLDKHVQSPPVKSSLLLRNMKAGESSRICCLKLFCGGCLILPHLQMLFWTFPLLIVWGDWRWLHAGYNSCSIFL